MEYPINHSPVQAVYGFVAADDVLRFAAMLMSEVVDEVARRAISSDMPGRQFCHHQYRRNFRKDRDRLKSAARRRSPVYKFMGSPTRFRSMAAIAENQMEKTPLDDFLHGIVTPNNNLLRHSPKLPKRLADVRRQDVLE